MKDPLQPGQTPYELLNLTPAAGDKEIDQAFKLGLARRGNVQKLTAAKRALQDPVERALIDIFRYYPEVLARLSPNPLEDPDALDPPRRPATAQSWEQGLKTSFPDVGAAHSLGVLWYWWALAEEERHAGGNGAEGNGAGGNGGGIPARQMWERVIAYWAMLVTSNDFWKGLAKLPDDVAAQAQSALIDRLNHRFHDLGQSYRNNGGSDLVARYHELELTLATEMRTARQVSRAGIRTRRGKITCGPLLLKRIGLLDTVVKQIDTGLTREPASKHLLALRDAFSACSHVAVLIENHKPQAALSALDALPAPERDRDDAVRLRARALFELGKQQASLEQFGAALDRWAEALRTLRGRGVAKDLEEKIAAEVVSTCLARAAAMQKKQSDEAVALLERALEVVSDEKLRLTLAEILTQRAINSINDAQKKDSGGGPEAEVVATVKRGLDDLERAAALGYERAVEQVQVARQLYRELTSGLRPIIREANEAAARDDWDKAVNILRGALRTAPRTGQEQVRQTLAACLASRAIDKCNRAVELLNNAMSAQEMLYERLSANAGRSDCAVCGKSRYASWGDDNWFTLTLKSGATANVCGGCSTVVQQAAAATSAPNPQAVELLNSAHKDLVDAAGYDPASEFVRTNLRNVEEILGQLKPRAAAAAAAAGGSGFASFLGIFVNWWWFIISALMAYNGTGGWKTLGVVGLIIFFVALLLYLFSAGDKK